MQSGSEQLKDWMKRRGFTQRETAKFFDWDETFISALVTEDESRRRRPGLTNAIRIERETGIPVEAWLSSERDGTEIVGAVKNRKRQ